MKITIFNGTTHYKRPFSIALLVITRGYTQSPSGCAWNCCRDSSSQSWLVVMAGDNKPPLSNRPNLHLNLTIHPHNTSRNPVKPKRNPFFTPGNWTYIAIDLLNMVNFHSYVNVYHRVMHPIKTHFWWPLETWNPERKRRYPLVI